MISPVWKPSARKPSRNAGRADRGRGARVVTVGAGKTLAALRLPAVKRSFERAWLRLRARSKQWAGRAALYPSPGQAPRTEQRAAAAFAASLTFESVERWYGATRALDGVSLRLEAGEIVCLLGPSGCGKTTLLRIASGVEKPSSGRVLINNQEVAGPARFVPPERRNVGLMFQDFALFPHLTLTQNVAFGLRSLEPKDAERIALGLIARVGLASYANRYPSALSGGEQQRIALARALAPRPAVVLMDEPFSGLDVQLRDAMQDETLELLKETRATALIVTHQPEEALKLADRIAVVRKGRLVQVGRGAELYRAPADLFVARLFSEINEVPARVLGGAISTPIGTFRVPDVAEGDACVLCLRQRGIKVLPAGQGLAGRVLTRRFLGDVGQIEIGAAGFEAPLKVRMLEDEIPQPGTDVGLSIDPASALIFPAT